MIILHTIKGQEFAINGGLIERVEQDNETHITLATGTNYLVREPLLEVVRLHRQDRATVRALAAELSEGEGCSAGDIELSGDDVVDPDAIGAIVQFPAPATGRRQP